MRCFCDKAEEPWALVHDHCLLPLVWFLHYFHLGYYFDDLFHQEQLFAFENVPIYLERDRRRQDKRVELWTRLSKYLSLYLMMFSFDKRVCLCIYLLCQLLTLLFQEPNAIRTTLISSCSLYISIIRNVTNVKLYI